MGSGRDGSEHASRSSTRLGIAGASSIRDRHLQPPIQSMARRDRIRGEAPLNINLTPLLDVVLQLITFFMMLIHFGTKLEGATKAVRLPVAPAALPGGDLAIDRLVVVLDARGAWWSRGASSRGRGPRRGGPGRPSFAGRGKRPWGGRRRSSPRSSSSAPTGTPRTGPSAGRSPRRRSGGSPTSPWSCCGSDGPMSRTRRRPGRLEADGGGPVPGHADARHGLPAPGLLRPDVPGADVRDAPGPLPAGHPRGDARRGRGPGRADPPRAGRIRTWRTTSGSAPRRTTWAS